MFVHRWKDKQMWDIHTMEYYSALNNKKWSSDTCYNMDKYWKYYAKWSQTQRYKYYMIHLYEIPGKEKKSYNQNVD